MASRLEFGDSLFIIHFYVLLCGKIRKETPGAFKRGRRFNLFPAAGIGFPSNRYSNLLREHFSLLFVEQRKKGAARLWRGTDYVLAMLRPMAGIVYSEAL
ncbi:hypothetical protein DdX_11697 [Ditylenchus destructor]|uniref:Uncharacterized protein n=1 Tax=Ditylenchus destructor TaxID=166010 RepID=A0AAD4MYT8_9BILA|nr:hypothetical protein DdX_11697 [Ditylenchus destructor]